jgi:hypothetical protein
MSVYRLWRLRREARGIGAGATLNGWARDGVVALCFNGREIRVSADDVDEVGDMGKIVERKPDARSEEYAEAPKGGK